jgi:hypothetical protein
MVLLISTIHVVMPVRNGGRYLNETRQLRRIISENILRYNGVVAVTAQPGMRGGSSQGSLSQVRWFKTVPSRKLGDHSSSRRRT